MNLSDEIRKQIEKNKGLKLAVGEINNHLSILEELVRKDIMEQVDEAYQTGYDKGYADKTNNDEVCKKLAKDIQDEAYKRGFEDGKAVNDKGCEGCLYNDGTKEHSPCDICCNAYLNRWTAKPQEDDEIKVGDEVVDSSGKKGLVVSDGNKCSDTIWLLINGYRVPQSVCKEDYTKTGRHFDIGKILEDMKA